MLRPDDRTKSVFRKKIKMKQLIILICVVLAVSTYNLEDVVSGRIETCRGCSLNRLPEVKQFVMQDAPRYPSISVEFISGAPPELVLLDASDHELDRLALSPLSRQECNQLLESKGFLIKTDL